MQHFHIVIRLQRFFQDRDQFIINLYRKHLSRIFAEILRQCADSRADFQYKIVLCDLCRIDNFIQHMRIDQKVLSKFFLKLKFMLLKHLYRLFWIA